MLYRAREDCDIMCAKEKQATAKQTFVFLAPLANEYPAEQDVQRVSANSNCKIGEFLLTKGQEINRIR